MKFKCWRCKGVNQVKVKDLHTHNGSYLHTEITCKHCGFNNLVVRFKKSKDKK